MKWLSVSLALCSLLALSRAVPFHPNSTSPVHDTPRQMGHCAYIVHDLPVPVPIGMFVPQCDASGNFLPQQCSGSTGYCWCVDVLTGEKIPGTETPPGVIPVSCDMEYHCPYDWSHFGKRCYYFVDSPKTWVEAESYCLFEGANLASIHSEEECHFIQSLTKAHSHDFPLTWLGGHNAVHSCFWMWNDGTKFDFDNWHKKMNMDDEMEKTECCLKINYGYNLKWHYASCNETLPFVCSKMIYY
ncbi:galactose-specific lectin nattectin [Sparus aurata]|uniref:Galactose-specific lectin nattectin-like n=1 Tax=Sparus aurata TaxID=8175 RepID=A0A671UEC8_SPAAU|nr:galactose-specific lectin nattectin-like [Sparus aurata]